ncbi:acyl-CoA dehydrogenase [Bacillus sp. HMF5848]|uniref:acyl-CoA dehydrogenase family protein n=1 Tax=Bacillus sp. HMF5848 TaxID=2495421 RepID=UPI000F7935A9|nr:acyl-CoA dehydrogenase family protein [Bacillus sp. HMF5848]RSK27361.1 acyl-CoA dehydrogenase [Bacillus sp. HMF5848]
MTETTKNVRGAGFLYENSEEIIFTPEDFTNEHKMIAQTAKQFIEKEVDPHNEAIENQDFKKVVSLLQKAGELGLLAHSIPETYGGLGLDKISKGLVGEIIGRTSGYGVAHSNHTCIATLPITYFGTDEQKRKYLPKLASGEYIGAYCLTEPGSGSDALAAKTTAVLNDAGTHYILNGTKIYITNAFFSDTFIVYAKVDGTKFTAFIVEKDFPGLSLGPEENKMGIKGSSTRSVIMEDCLVPVENLLGEVGKGHVIALNVLNLGRFNLGSACMGAAKYGLKLALQFTSERQQFGRSIADFPATKEKIANMAATIYAAESLQYRTAGLLEDALGELYDSNNYDEVARRMMEYATECAICKVFGSETLDYVADEALQLHGGAGFIKEYKVEQMYRDSRINRIFEGTNEINRLLIPTHLFRKVSKGELQLEEQVQKALLDMQTPKYSFTGILEREQEAVQLFRRLFLVCAGSAFETYGARLQEEQEVLMKLSDLAIMLFASQSAVLRSMQAISNNSAEKEQAKVLLTKVLVDEYIYAVSSIAQKLLLCVTDGEKGIALRNLVTKNLSAIQEQGYSERKRQLSSILQEKVDYSC